MKITRATDYSIRLLMHLASGDGKGTSIDLSKELDIPFNHLAKLVQNLSRRGYLATRKGKGGGLKLARNPKDISLSEIIEMTEGPITFNECLFHKDSCRFSTKCKFRKYLSNIQGKIRKLFSNQTIFDLITSN